MDTWCPSVLLGVAAVSAWLGLLPSNGVLVGRREAG